MTLVPSETTLTSKVPKYKYHNEIFLIGAFCYWDTVTTVFLTSLPDAPSSGTFFPPSGWENTNHIRESVIHKERRA